MLGSTATPGHPVARRIGHAVCRRPRSPASSARLPGAPGPVAADLNLSATAEDQDRGGGNCSTCDSRLRLP